MKKITAIVLVLAMALFCLPAVSAETATGGTRDTVLVLDNSGSMSGEPCKALKDAAKSFCSTILSSKGTNRIAIVIYDTDVDYSLDFTSDLTTLNTALDNLDGWGGTTNITAGVEKADELFSASSATVKNMVVMSDGAVNEGKSNITGKYVKSDNIYYDYANSLYDTASSMWSRCNIYTMGFYHDLSENGRKFPARVLSDIQNKGYYEVTDPTKLVVVFEDVAEDINNDADNQVNNNMGSYQPKFIFNSDIEGYSLGWKGVINQINSMPEGSTLTVNVSSTVRVVPMSVIEALKGKDISVTFTSSRFEKIVNGRDINNAYTLRLR